MKPLQGSQAVKLEPSASSNAQNELRYASVTSTATTRTDVSKGQNGTGKAIDVEEDIRTIDIAQNECNMEHGKREDQAMKEKTLNDTIRSIASLATKNGEHVVNTSDHQPRIGDDAHDSKTNLNCNEPGISIKKGYVQKDGSIGQQSNCTTIDTHHPNLLDSMQHNNKEQKAVAFSSEVVHGCIAQSAAQDECDVDAPSKGKTTPSQQGNAEAKARSTKETFGLRLFGGFVTYEQLRMALLKPSSSFQQLQQVRKVKMKGPGGKGFADVAVTLESDSLELKPKKGQSSQGTSVQDGMKQVAQELLSKGIGWAANSLNGAIRRMRGSNSQHNLSTMDVSLQCGLMTLRLPIEVLSQQLLDAACAF